MGSSTSGETNGNGVNHVADPESDPESFVNGETSPGQETVVSHDPDDGVKRTSNMWIAAAYNVTAIIGVGVLALPHAMVFLTWAPGVVVLVLAIIITYFTMTQLIKLHECELLNKGIRYSTYHKLGQRAFGDFWGFWLILPLQMVVEVSLDILFTIVAGEAMDRIYDSAKDCRDSQHIFIWFAVFATVQLVLSFLLPTFEDIKLIVVISAVMSICYSTIAWITIVSVGGRPDNISYNLPNSLPVDNTPWHPIILSDKDLVFRAFNSIGIVAFAYAAHNIVLEIQNGIPSTSRESSEKAMLHGVWITYVLVAICYFPMAIAVYYMHGNQISHNVLSFMFHRGAPKALVIIANSALIIHLVGSYQIFALPVFKQLEISFKRCSPFIIRPVYIVSTTAIAMIFPYFSPLLGFFGGFAIAPTTYFLPCVIWLCIRNPTHRWKSKDWYFNLACIILGVILMIVATSGGLYTLIKEWHTFGYYRLWTNNWKDYSLGKNSCPQPSPEPSPSPSPRPFPTPLSPNP